MSARIQGRVSEIKVGLKRCGKVGMWVKAGQDPNPRTRHGQGAQWLMGSESE